MKNHLVILGGMGPQASLQLHRLLLEGSMKFHDCKPDDFPFILHASMQIPDFVSSPDNCPEVVRLINDVCSASHLDSSSAVGIACNTAHMLLEQLEIPPSKFVSMIDEAVKCVVDSGSKHIGLLASPNTILSKLYEGPLTEAGLNVITPNAEELDKLGEVIRGVISGDSPELFAGMLQAIADRMTDDGADCILLGCTELPLVGVQCSVQVVDSLSALSGAMLRRHYDA